MSISTPFIQRPIATSLLMLGILLVGIAAYPLLPVAPLPQVDFPTIQVTTQFADASPETMASSVAQPLETQFAQIPGLSQMSSTSALGNTVVSLQFDLNRNIDAAAGDVQAAINAASGQLPKTLPTPPTYRKVNPADSPIMVLAVHSSTLPLTTVDNYAETIIAQQISQLSGVAYVAIGGQQKPAVRIQVDPAKLASLGLSLEDVRSVILQATTDAPKGNLDGATHNFAVYDNDQLTTAAPWNDVIIAYRNGAPVRVRDIGQAVDGPQNRELAAWDGETPSIILIIFKQPGANVINTVDRIKAGLPQMTTAIPPAVKVDIASDRTTTIRASVTDVEFTMMLTIALVVAVIFVFLRTVWATVIPGITVPLALVGTLGLMYVFGFSLDNLSLMGLTIAVGFVVDDAIVMLENIHRHIEEGLAARRRHHWCRRDWLHDRVDQPIADRGVHPAAADGRNPRPVVPRIRHRCVDDDRCLGGGVADADADDVRAFSQQREGRSARPALPSRRKRLRWAAQRLSVRARFCPATPAPDPWGLFRHCRDDRIPVRHHPERVLSPTGHRTDHRFQRSSAGCLVRRNGPPPACVD